MYSYTNTILPYYHMREFISTNNTDFFHSISDLRLNSSLHQLPQLLLGRLASGSAL